MFNFTRQPTMAYGGAVLYLLESLTSELQIKLGRALHVTFS
jgi:hypothetical protein